MNDKYVYIKKGDEKILSIPIDKRKDHKDAINNAFSFFSKDVISDYMVRIDVQLVPIFQDGALLIKPKKGTRHVGYKKNVGEFITSNGIIKPDSVSTGYDFMNKFEFIILSNILYAVLETQSRYWYEQYRDDEGLPYQLVMQELGIRPVGFKYNVVTTEDRSQTKIVVYLNVDKIDDEYKFVYLPFDAMRRINRAIEREAKLTGYIEELAGYARLEAFDHRNDTVWLRNVCSDVFDAIEYKNPFVK